jgi:hypothetical protein
MRLVYDADPTQEVEVGDVVYLPLNRDDPSDTRVRRLVVRYFRPPHKPSSSGKVVLEEPNMDEDRNSLVHEYYVGVIGATWIEREDRP